MSTPSPALVQTPAPALLAAVNLLDGLLLRDDLTTAARLDLSDVYDDLLAVNPPYPPNVPTPQASSEPWPAVTHQIVALLHRLIDSPEPGTAPAELLRYGLAARTLRRTADTAEISGGRTAGRTTGQDQ